MSDASPTAEAFADKILRAVPWHHGAFNFYLGDRLGWFDALAQATAAELAKHALAQLLQTCQPLSGL
jgi:hypothetical protein